MSPTTDKWLAAQAAFISGESARAVSTRLGLSLPALRKQIQRGQWVSQRDLGPNRAVVPRKVSRELLTLSKRLSLLSQAVVTAST